MENKIIIVIYLGVGNETQEAVADHISSASKQIGSNDPEILTYIIPAFGTTNTKVECINPQIVTGEEYKSIIEKLDEVTKQVNEFIIDKN